MSDVESARAELSATLDAIEAKLDVRRQVAAIPDAVKASYRRHPIAWIAGGVLALGGLVGLIAWAINDD